MALIFLLLLFLFTPFICLAQSHSPLPSDTVSNTLVLDLVGTVIQDASPADVEIPTEIKDIVSEYYADATVSDEVAFGILSYLNGIYSDHGYHDTGSWASDKNFINYRPFTGTLPEYDSEDFKMPVDGKITSSYGYRPTFGRHHRGVDVALNIGDTVRSALPGVVTKTGYEPSGYGRYVVVSHSGGMETLYGHLMTYLVNPGKKIEAGEPLGLGGVSGNATGPHLHFETRYRGVPINPSSWLPSSLLFNK